MLTARKRQCSRARVIPIYGYIHAGTTAPVPGPDTQPIDYLDISQSNMRVPRRIYGLTVKGDSMVDARVNNGDIVLIKPQSTADNGDLIIARLRTDPTTLETTFKRFYRKGRHIVLKPENPAYSPIIAKPEQVEVMGIVLGVWRKNNK